MNIQLIPIAENRCDSAIEKERKYETEHVFGFLSTFHVLRIPVSPSTIEKKHKRGEDMVLGVLKVSRAMIFKPYAKSAVP